VAIFENRTSDPSLDNLGRMTTESVTQRLGQVNSIQLVPNSRVLEIANASTENNRRQDSARALAEETTAGLVVSGVIYQQDQKLEVRTTIMDVIANKPLWAVGPAEGTRDEAAQIADEVAKRVTDVVAARYLNPIFNLLVEEERAPALEAQKEFATGLDLFFSDPSAAIVHNSRAVEIDH
jgi:TolB-like protein